MPTLTHRSLELSIVHLSRDEYHVRMALGLFVDGRPVLTPVCTRDQPGAPPGHILVDDEVGDDICLSSRLRRALDRDWTTFWASEPDEEVRISFFGSGFYYLLRPNYSVDEYDVLGSLAMDSTEHFRREVNGSHGVPEPNPDHQFVKGFNDFVFLKVVVDPWSLGAQPAAMSGLGFDLMVPREDVRTWLDELDRDRAALPNVMEN